MKLFAAIIIILYEWLSGLFDIPFIPKQYAWIPPLDVLESDEVDFAGDLTANSERRKTFIMSDAIAQRSLKYYRITGNDRMRLPRYILKEKTTTADVLIAENVQRAFWDNYE
jgi:hypothetical protein